MTTSVFSTYFKRLELSSKIDKAPVNLLNSLALQRQRGVTGLFAVLSRVAAAGPSSWRVGGGAEATVCQPVALPPFSWRVAAAARQYNSPPTFTRLCCTGCSSGAPQYPSALRWRARVGSGVALSQER